jgi:hypothetical protein
MKMFRRRRIHSAFNRHREEINRKYAQLGKAPGADRGQIQHDHDRETEECIYGLWSFESVRLLRQADRYDVNHSNPDWYVDSDLTEGDKEILTKSAQRELQRLIHVERRTRIEWWITKAILPILQSIAAVIGVLIGLIAILKN